MEVITLNVSFMINLLAKVFSCAIHYVVTVFYILAGYSLVGSRITDYWKQQSQHYNEKVQEPSDDSWSSSYTSERKIIDSLERMQSQQSTDLIAELEFYASNVEELSSKFDKISRISTDVDRSDKKQNSSCPKLDRFYFKLLAMFPERYITEKCICKAKELCTYRKLEGTEMKECHCLSHQRFTPNNIRVKTENVIVHHIIKTCTEKSVRMLSLGPGAYLQDLMIVLRLVEAGIKCIHVTLVEPNPCWTAYQDFKFYLEKMALVYDMDYISYSSFTDIDQVGCDKQFDVIYAIDYKECSSTEYLREHLHDEENGDDEMLRLDSDKSAWDLIKATKLLTSKNHGLVIVSKCKEILHKSGQNIPVLQHNVNKITDFF